MNPGNHHSCRDITALRKNETRFTELFETLQEGIYIITPEGNILT